MKRITTNRKGISFTLTLVVVGVVLLMTALTVIVLGSGSIFGQTERADGAASSGAIANACNNLAARINGAYCSNYVNGDISGQDEKCSQTNDNARGAFNQRATDAGCNWWNQKDGSTAASQRIRQYLKNPANVVPESDPTYDATVNSLRTPDGSDLQPLVQVQGDWYNCLIENEMSRVCPA